jgi:hypothetical protein
LPYRYHRSVRIKGFSNLVSKLGKSDDFAFPPNEDAKENDFAGGVGEGKREIGYLFDGTKKV